MHIPVMATTTQASANVPMYDGAKLRATPATPVINMLTTEIKYKF